MTRRRIRVCVVDAGPGVAAYPRLDECDLEVVGALPGIADALRAPISDLDLVIVGAFPRDLRDARFQSRITRLARRLPTALVVPKVTRRAAIVAANARVSALVVRDAPPTTFVHAMRAAFRGEVAYPHEAVTRLLRLVPTQPV